MIKDQRKGSWDGKEDGEMKLGLGLLWFSGGWQTPLKAEGGNSGLRMSQHTGEPLPSPHLPHQPQLLPPPTLSLKYKLQEAIKKGYWLLEGEAQGWERGGDNYPQSDLPSSPISIASSQPWPELMNLRERSCLLFVCHFEVFWLIKIYASRGYNITSNS